MVTVTLGESIGRVNSDTTICGHTILDRVVKHACGILTFLVKQNTHG